MRYGIELHARGRKIVDCEAYDKGSKTSIPYKGFITSQDSQTITLCVPSAKNTKHRFSTLNTGDGYGYEGSAFGARGWRIPLSQLENLSSSAELNRAEGIVDQTL